jgi:hypothetical protein
VLPAPVLPTSLPESFSIAAGEKKDFEIEWTRKFGFEDEVEVRLEVDASTALAIAATKLEKGASRSSVAIDASGRKDAGETNAILKVKLRYGDKNLEYTRSLRVRIDAPNDGGAPRA